ncbi:hypothetical protein BHM03_00036227 [Ensete ventricosum]|nr:hypothetical protein BHM03_00036227 [Ensete ventricosum]
MGETRQHLALIPAREGEASKRRRLLFLHRRARRRHPAWGRARGATSSFRAGTRALPRLPVRGRGTAA